MAEASMSIGAEGSAVPSSRSVRQLNPISGKRVLVTGAAGFLGSNLCRRLQSAGARVYGVTRRPAPDSAGTLTWIQADCSNPQVLRSTLRQVQPQVIYHLTGCGVGSPDLEAVLPTLQNDLVACVNLLTVAAEIGSERTVLAASLEEPTGPDDSPASPYAAAKWSCSTYARMFHHLFSTPVSLVRPYMTYGPGQRPHKIIPSVIISILKGRAPELGSGRRPVDWVYVDDVVEGMIAVAETSGLEGVTIDLGSGTSVTIREVVNRIVALMGRQIEPRFSIHPDRPSEVIRIADVVSAQALLGWTPKTPLEEGLRKTIEWYRNEISRGREPSGLLSTQERESIKAAS